MELVTSDFDMDAVARMTEAVMETVKREDNLYRKANVIIEGIESADILKALKMNEAGDAWILKTLCKYKLCLDHASNQWYLWNGNHWEEDRKKEYIQAIEYLVDENGKEVQRQARIRIQAIKDKNQDKADEAEKLEKDLLKRIHALHSLHRRKNVMFLASSGNDSLAISGDEWDSDPYLLGCANGVIDLRTGKRHKGRPENYILMASPTRWETLNESCDTWEQFLLDIFDNNVDLCHYLQRLLGYAISGLSKEHILPILWGEGRNGKGTMLEVISSVLGPIAGPIPAEMLLAQGRVRSSAGPSPDIMALRGRRIAWASETNEGRYFDIGKVKWMVGADTLTARQVHGKRQIEFSPTHTLFLLTNHKPHVSADEYAMWKRMHLIPFQLKFVDNPVKDDERERDPDMKDKLLSESSGILAWLVRGFLDWKRYGLNPPQEVLEATKEYQSEEDILGHFLKDCVNEEFSKSIRSNVLYTSFKNWCQENGHRPMSSTKFGRKIGKRFQRTRDSKGTVYKGLDLIVARLPTEDFVF